MYVKSIFLLITIMTFVALKPVKSMSADQVEKIAKNMRKSCLQKITTTEELIDGMRRGEFPDDHDLQCYTTCIMKLLRTFKNGNIDFDMIVKQLEITMPPEEVVIGKEIVAVCRNEEYTGDDCQKTYQYVQCHYKQNPEKFFFP
ncbi:general odorant-binding protein 99b-like [Apis dorsata]|uniref:general odorant-binding protein 99b-like n=1 Tax=Apis dorsata TaxID=7462 RepID=UPI0003DF4BC8|nr:general odorant-binding protein 99b-like [Apis dorsata]